MKIIRINKCFDDCPHCTGPDYNKQNKKMMFTCQEIPKWIDDEDSIPEWCPLPDLHRTPGEADAQKPCRCHKFYKQQNSYNFCPDCGRDLRISAKAEIARTKGQLTRRCNRLRKVAAIPATNTWSSPMLMIPATFSPIIQVGRTSDTTRNILTLTPRSDKH